MVQGAWWENLENVNPETLSSEFTWIMTGQGTARIFFNLQETPTDKGAFIFVHTQAWPIHFYSHLCLASTSIFWHHFSARVLPRMISWRLNELTFLAWPWLQPSFLGPMSSASPCTRVFSQLFLAWRSTSGMSKSQGGLAGKGRLHHFLWFASLRRSLFFLFNGAGSENTTVERKTLLPLAVQVSDWPLV